MEFFDSKLKKNPLAYITYLQSQNRAKRQSEVQDKEKLINKQKEEAFNLYLQGANEQRVDSQRKREKITRLREKSVSANSRKKWSAELPKSKLQEKRANHSPHTFSEEISESRSVSVSDLSHNLAKVDVDSCKEEIITHLKEFKEKQLLCVLNYLNNLLCIDDV